FLVEATRAPGPEPWIALASVYLEEGDAGRAEDAARQALARSPMHPWSLAVRGHALVKEGRRDEGLAALHEALRLHPRRPEVWQSLASAFAAAGDQAAAASCRREAGRRGRPRLAAARGPPSAAGLDGPRLDQLDRAVRGGIDHGGEDVAVSLLLEDQPRIFHALRHLALEGQDEARAVAVLGAELEHVGHLGLVEPEAIVARRQRRL